MTVKPSWAFPDLAQEHSALFNSWDCFCMNHASRGVNTGRRIIHITSQMKKTFCSETEIVWKYKAVIKCSQKLYDKYFIQYTPKPKELSWLFSCTELNAKGTTQLRWKMQTITCCCHWQILLLYPVVNTIKFSCRRCPIDTTPGSLQGSIHLNLICSLIKRKTNRQKVQ